MFSFNHEPEHRQQMRNSVAEFINRAVSTKDMRESLATPQGFSISRWKEMSDLGWTSLLLPEDLGGLAMEYGDLVALHHEVARAPLSEPLAIIPLLVSQALAMGDNRPLAESKIPQLTSSEKIATLAWQGLDGALGATEVGPTAKSKGNQWILSGKAIHVPCAGAATSAIVAAKTEERIALFWLEDCPAFSDPVRHCDGSVTATLTLDGLAATAEALIAEPGCGSKILENVLDTARLAACAELLGLMEKSLEMTLEHLRQRQQFGKPIGSFQALQHRAVDLFIQIELARSATDRAARAFEKHESASFRAAHVSAAKSRCGDAAQLVVRECIQMHGAIGYTREYDLSLFINRALYLCAWLGNPARHRQRWLQLQTFTGGHS